MSGFYKLKIVLAGLLIFGISLSGQKSGYRFGINLTTMSIRNNGEYIKAQTPVGIHFGMMYELPLAGKLVMQSGFLFSSKGTDYDIDNTYHSVAPAYLEIPVNGAYYIGSRKFKIILFGGPYLAAAFGGYKITGEGAMTNLAIGGRNTKDIRCFDVGVNIGTSLSIKNFFITFQYGHGFRNVSPSGGFEMKNRTGGISIGTLYELERK